MSNILISTPPTSLATGLLQLDGGVAISSTPVYVADQNNTDSVLSLSTGNVGINTTSTFARLTIANTNTLNTQYLISASTSTASFYVRNDGYLYNAEQGRISNVLIANLTSNSLSSTSSSSSGGALYLTGTGIGIGGTTSFTPSAMAHIKGSTSSGAVASLLVQNSGGAQLFRVDNDGTVTGFFGSFTNGLYIGTPGTAGRLSIKSGGSTSSTNAIFVQNSGASQLLLVRDDGNIGIGAVTTNPAYQVTQGRYGIPTYFICNTQLQDAGTVGQVVGNFQFGFSPSSTTASIGAIKCITDTTWYNGRLAFFTQSGDGTISLATEKMTLLANGNLMVNTTTDLGSKVGIKGSGSTSATTNFLVQNSSGTELCKIDDSGSFEILRTSSGSQFKISSANFLLSNVYAQYWDSAGQVLYRDGNVKMLIGGSTFQNGAKLQIDSTTQGFLPPRMTTGQKLAILTPASGLMVYDTSLNQMSYFNGAVWVNI